MQKSDYNSLVCNIGLDYSRKNPMCRTQPQPRELDQVGEGAVKWQPTCQLPVPQNGAATSSTKRPAEGLDCRAKSPGHHGSDSYLQWRARHLARRRAGPALRAHSPGPLGPAGGGTRVRVLEVVGEFLAAGEDLVKIETGDRDTTPSGWEVKAEVKEEAASSFTLPYVNSAAAEAHGRKWALQWASVVASSAHQRHELW
ncbi:hypothetical protein PG985_013251 [Apiospora marii]|uniref:uncharacterized protein n=1 Tax=Apiospora marii TaxID=335849 RepID=UPI0031309FC1